MARLIAGDGCEALLETGVPAEALAAVEGVDDADLTLEKGDKAAHPDESGLFGDLRPLLLIGAEVEVLGAPLLAFPAVVEFAVGGEVDEFVVNLSDDDGVSSDFAKLT